MDKFAHFFSIFFIIFFAYSTNFFGGLRVLLRYVFFLSKYFVYCFFLQFIQQNNFIVMFFSCFSIFFSLLVENVDNVFFIVYLNWWINVTKFLEIFTLWKYLLLWNQRIQTNCLRNKKWYPIPILGILNQF